MNLLDLLKSDLLTVYGQPLLDLLAGVISAQGDPLKLANAALVFEAKALAGAPQALAGLETALAEALQVKVQEWVNAAKKA